MDEMNEDPSEICSFHVNEVIREGTVDLNKKRKLLDELLGLPPPKYKFRDRSSGSVQLFPFVEDSEMVSNSLVGESNSTSSPSTESISQPELPKSLPSFLMTTIGGIQPTSSVSESSTSTGSSSNSNCKDSVYSSESTSMEAETSDKEEESSLFFKDQKLLADYIGSEHASDEIEEFLDIKSEEIMLYSNAAASDPFVLSSGRWNINKDADTRLGVKKPTIDQEFEQYFSTLML